MMATKSRDDLLEEKRKVDLRLSQIKTSLLRAKAKAAAYREYLDPDTYASLEIERSRLAAKSQHLQQQLGHITKQDKLDRQVEFLQCFREAAEATLAKKTLVIILDAAHAIQRAKKLHL